MTSATLLLRRVRRRSVGLLILLRPLATLSWAGGACLLLAGLARQTSPSGELAWPLFWRALSVGVVIQGWLSHSLNDRVDWLSGTDQNAREYFSGGSGVIRLGYFGPRELGAVAVLSLLLLVALAMRASAPPAVWLLLAVGLWGAIAYSSRPWRLSYYPLAGEWLAAFPAVLACGLATYLLLAPRLEALAVIAAALHGLLCVAWLMQHHLPDCGRDLQATPPKRTTVAIVAARFGLARARWVVVGYFLLAALLAVLAGQISRRFQWTALFALGGAALAMWQNVSDRRQVAGCELGMIALTLVNALLVGWF